MIGTILSDTLTQIRNLGVARNDMSDNDLRWWAVIYLADHCLSKSKSYTLALPAKRANGEEWGIMGYEQVEFPEDCAIGQNAVASPEPAKNPASDANPEAARNPASTTNPETAKNPASTANPEAARNPASTPSPKIAATPKSVFWYYKIDGYGLWERDLAITPADVLFLGDVIRNNRNQASFSASEAAQWHNIENRFAHADSAGNIIPDILVMYYDDLNKIGHMWSSHPLFEKVLDNIEATFAETLKILRQNANPILHDQLAYCTSMHMLVDLRMITMHDEVSSGRLVPPKNPKHSKAATWLVLER